MHEIKALIDDEGEGVGCFDPWKVAYALTGVFPGGISVCLHDYAWNDYDAFKQRAVVEGTSGSLEDCIRVAERDAFRRGPIVTFHLFASPGQVILGKAERYAIAIWSDQPLPPDVVERCTTFLHTLRFDPFKVRVT